MHIPARLQLPFSSDLLSPSCQELLSPYHLTYGGLLNLLRFEFKNGTDYHLSSYLMEVSKGHPCPLLEEHTKLLLPQDIPHQQRVYAPSLPTGPVVVAFQIAYRDYMTHLLQHASYAARKVSYRELLPLNEELMLLMKGKEAQILGGASDCYQVRLEKKGPHMVLLQLEASIVLQPFIQGG